MRIFCWNVNSLVPTVRNINLKYGSLTKFFQELDADIVCMQEVKLPFSKLTKDLVVVDGYQSYWACSEGKTGYSGVTTWARHAYAAVTADADPLSCEGCEKEGRSIWTDHGNFVLFNVYVPNAGDRPERARLQAKVAFLQSLKERVDVLVGSGRQVIAVGDFNVAAEQRDVHSAITWGTLYEQQELDALHALFDSCNDTWRHLHSADDGVYTVWNEKTSARAFNVGLRIDYALCSKGLMEHVRSCEIMLDLPPKWSDHAPLLLDLDLTTAETTAPQTSRQQQQPQVMCPMWQQLLKQFADPSQRSIASMFRASGSSRALRPAAAAATGSSGRLSAVNHGQDGAPAAEAPHQQLPVSSSAAGAAEAVEGGHPESCCASSCKRPHEHDSEGPSSAAAAARPAAKLARHGEKNCPDYEVGSAPGATKAPRTAAQVDVEQRRPPPSSQGQQQQPEGQQEGSRTEVTSCAEPPKQHGTNPRARCKGVNGRPNSKQKASGEQKPGPRQARLQSFFAAPAKPK